MLIALISFSFNLPFAFVYYHERYLSTLHYKVDPAIGFIQPGSTHFKDSTTLAPKLADPPFQWKSLTPPPLNLDPVYRSGSSNILYYLKMFVIEILADILACLLDLNVKQSKLTRPNF
jgi:hypothetical protein